MIAFVSRTRIIFIQMSRKMIFYVARDTSKVDVRATQGLLLEINGFFLEINISMTYGKSYSFLEAALPQCCSIIVSIFLKPGDMNTLFYISSTLNSLIIQLFPPKFLFYLREASISQYFSQSSL